MLLDWICSIFALVINLPLSFVDGLKRNEALGLNIGGTCLIELDDGVESVNISDSSHKL
jgi:hypothetical protein